MPQVRALKLAELGQGGIASFISKADPTKVSVGKFDKLIRIGALHANNEELTSR